ncbi:MAG: HRDC domain-containing protein [Nocardioidaceae bacterium]
MIEAPTPGAPDDTEEHDEPPLAPLLELRDGLPPVVDEPAAYERMLEAFSSASGPVALDAERASGYRYSQRAYLIQLRREGAGTTLIDPIPFESQQPLQQALGDAEWILHAASQDLACLAEIGLRPGTLFDTELAGRLLGYPRVGLATLVETTLGRRMKKEHSAVDWSTRPLPQPWLEYAALDVEVLIELRELLGRELEAAGKQEWAAQEFAHLAAGAPASPRVDPWRRTSGLHRVRGRRGLAAVRALWETRDEIAARRDLTPGRIIGDAAIVEAANALPRDRRTLLGLHGFHGRGAERYANQWVAALREARELPETDLPELTLKHDGPPPPRAWADKDPAAAARLTAARAAMSELSEQHNVPIENLLSPDLLRRILWEPPAGEGPLEARVRERLAAAGARPWQIDLTTPVILAAL